MDLTLSLGLGNSCFKERASDRLISITKQRWHIFNSFYEFARDQVVLNINQKKIWSKRHFLKKYLSKNLGFVQKNKIKVEFKHEQHLNFSVTLLRKQITFWTLHISDNELSKIKARTSNEILMNVQWRCPIKDVTPRETHSSFTPKKMNKTIRKKRKRVLEPGTYTIFQSVSLRFSEIHWISMYRHGILSVVQYWQHHRLF